MLKKMNQFFIKYEVLEVPMNAFSRIITSDDSKCKTSFKFYNYLLQEFEISFDVEK